MASIGRRKRIAFSNAVRSRRALRTLWHNACISYRRYEKIRERISFTDLELMTRLELVTSSLPTAFDAQKCYCLVAKIQK